MGQFMVYRMKDAFSSDIEKLNVIISLFNKANVEEQNERIIQLF